VQDQGIPVRQRTWITHNGKGILHLGVSHDAPGFVIVQTLTMIARKCSVKSSLSVNGHYVVHLASSVIAWSPFGRKIGWPSRRGRARLHCNICRITPEKRARSGFEEELHQEIA